MSFGRKRIPKHLVLYDYPSSQPKTKPKWRWLVISVFLVCSGLFFALNTRANELESAGSLSFKSSGASTVALHLETTVSAEINGLVAHVRYEQRFKNQSSDWQQGLYSFPLPETAGINYMEMKIADRTIIGEIKEKHEAKKIYQEAVRQGKRAALTEQQRPNMFTQKVANIPPGEEVLITIQYQQKVEFRDMQFEWRLPTTFTPRYIPGTHLVKPAMANSSERQDVHANTPIQVSRDGWALATDQVPDAHLITPTMKHASAYNSNPLSLSVKLNSGLSLSNISSLYHDVSINKRNQTHSISFKNKFEEMDRDFVLQWTPAASNVPQAAVFSEEIEGDTYSLLMVLPPINQENQELARDITFIIDTSGSMQGPSIRHAKQSLSLALQQLSNKDRFNIVEFNSTHSLAFSNVVPATQENIQNALHWVQKLNASGGTEMYSALNAAFNQMPNEERLQQLVFITDGAVGNETALFKLIHSKLGTSRLFTVGIGSAPNSYFMRKSAEFGRGSFSHIAANGDIKHVMTALFNKLNSAVSTNIKVDWLQHAEQYPEKIGELYRDEALLVTAKTKTAPTRINIVGELDQRQWHQSISNNKKDKNRGIGSLWAREKIEHIEDQVIAGSIVEDEAKKSILSIALAHKLVSRFTSFIAVEKQRARPASEPLRKARISNQVAKGQSVSPVVLPQTATMAEFAWWLGLFALIASLFILRMKGDKQ